MATQAIHARQSSGASSTMSLGYPPAPGSPTLTNPDMILPDYDGGSPDRSESPLRMWQNNHANMVFKPQDLYATTPATPTTPIIYGNGTMLSDIGEVTEVESTVGGRSPIASRKTGDHTAHDDTHHMPVNSGYGVHKKRPRPQHDRRASVGSNSTVTSAHEPRKHFADFDDAVSVDDSCFQGDDEESIAESTMEERQAKFLPPPHGAGLMDQNRNSTVSLSAKAEEILANAKQRLTTMEGNLSRARTSLESPTTSSNGSGTPSPPRARTGSAVTSPTSLSGPMPMWTDFSGGESSGPYTARASSAMGAAGGYRQALSGSQSMGNLVGGYSSGSLSHHPLGVRLEPLTEDDSASDFHLKRDSARLDSFLSPTFGTYEDQGIPRSASAAQVRDLKDQMQDLKGRLSSLRDQARQDSMKRRSLQSLRAPSPFTHAQVEQWYAGPVQEDPVATPTAAQGRNPWNGELESVDGEGLAKAHHPAPQQHVMDDDEESVISEYVAAQEAIRDEEQEAANLEGSRLDDDVEDLRTEDGFEVDRDDASESGDSVYHDTHQTPLSHEDREDAFDYEHFFLHSALGSFSQRCDSTSSIGSDDSVETTRGPTTDNVDDSDDSSLRRRASTDTMNTVDSFATANEDPASRAQSALDHPNHAARVLALTQRTDSPATATRTNFGPDVNGNTDPPRSQPDERPLRQRSSSVIYSRPFSSSAAYRGRPSVSSFESVGTTRSFPLVNRPRLNGGVLTPQGTPPHGSPEPALKHVTESLMNETASMYSREGAHGPNSPAIQQLAKEDQILVERLVASLGNCVLGLSEAGKASAEGRDYRRRLEMARRLLDGSSTGA